MAKISDLKRGSIVLVEETPHVVEDLVIQTPSARGGASIYKIRFRSLTTKQKRDKTFKGEDVLPAVAFDRREVQYLYHQGDTYEFMDLADYSQFGLSAEDIADEVPYLVEDMEDIRALVADGKILGIELPPVVEMPVEQCDPSIRGASATARTKPATLPTGLVVQVPEYLSQGQVIRVDTRTGKFLSRA